MVRIHTRLQGGEGRKMWTVDRQQSRNNSEAEDVLQLVECSPSIREAPNPIPAFYKPDWAAGAYNHSTMGSEQRSGTQEDYKL